MASFVAVSPPTATVAPSEVAHVARGAIACAFAPTYADGLLGGPGTIYRMRAYDCTHGRLVYLNSSMLDAAGVDYVGPGPLLMSSYRTTMGHSMLTLVPKVVEVL